MLHPVGYSEARYAALVYLEVFNHRPMLAPVPVQPAPDGHLALTLEAEAEAEARVLLPPLVVHAAAHRHINPDLLPPRVYLHCHHCVPHSSQPPADHRIERLTDRRHKTAGRSLKI